MPIYEYEHLEQGCMLGKTFEISQSLSCDKLTRCPECGHEVKRIVSLFAVSSPTGNSELKNQGFTKLVRRDDGVYENVTATGNESKIFDASKPETMPDLASKIRD